MTTTFLDSEVDAWYFYMLRSRLPLCIAIFLRDAVFTLNHIGPISPSELHLTGLPFLIPFFWLIGRLKSTRNRRLATLFFYQIMQILQLVFAFQYPQISFFFIIVSTMSLVHKEMSLMLGTVQCIVLIVKHFAMWGVFIWKTTGLGEVNIDVVITFASTVAHFSHFMQTREEALRSKEENMRELQAEKERMQALLQSIPDGVLVVTEDKQVVTYNQMLLRMLQLEGRDNPEELLSPALKLLTYAPLYKKTASLCQHLLEDVLEHIASVKENTSIDFGSVEYRGHYLEWRGTTSLWNQTRACILVVREVGQWVELEALAKRENEAKSALIRSVSHELRTPINAILNVSQRLMEDSSISGEQKEQCQILVSSSNFLLSNVNDLLDFSRIANQQFSLNKQLFKLEEAIKACADLIRLQCRLKGLHLSFRYDSSIPSFVYNDPNRLKQVLLNLLSNALKFTLKGKIEVVATLLNPNTVKIAVEDTGIGITPANQQKLFTLFGKLTGNEKLNPQGCGLGLAISNTLVLRMGGQGISVQSTSGRGSTFSFLLPICDNSSISVEEGQRETVSSDICEIAEEAKELLLPTSSALWKDPILTVNTLIVDDSEFNRVVLRQLLESQAFRCEEANTGAEALRKIEQKARENSPYLYIFLDIEMPEMSGIEVAVELRRQVGEGTLARAQVIGCSAYVSPEDRQSCLDAGMDFFLEKPVSRDHLTALCESFQ